MKFFCLALAVVAALVSTAVRVVYERNQTVQLGFDIAEESQKIRKLEEEMHQLRIDRAALLDPKRLAPMARQAGLHVATPDEVVSVYVEGEIEP